MNLNEYYELPDSMTPKDLAILFIKLLDPSKLIETPDLFETAEALDQLADRQWHTYELLDADIKGRVVEWIQSNWDKESLEFTELVTSIIAKLGLLECVPLLKAALKENLPEDVKEEIIESLKEYEKDVGDPYSGIR